MANRSLYVIAYDMCNDRRRAKLARLMESYGARVQGSVFEAYLTALEVKEIIGKSKRLIKEEDTLRLYFLCEDCRQKVQVLGTGQVSEPPGVVIL